MIYLELREETKEKRIEKENVCEYLFVNNNYYFYDRFFFF